MEQAVTSGIHAYAHASCGEIDLPWTYRSQYCRLKLARVLSREGLKPLSYISTLSIGILTDIKQYKGLRYNRQHDAIICLMTQAK